MLHDVLEFNSCWGNSKTFFLHGEWNDEIYQVWTDLNCFVYKYLNRFYSFMYEQVYDINKFIKYVELISFTMYEPDFFMYDELLLYG